MQTTPKLWLSHISKIKNIWLIIAVVVLGVILCLYDPSPISDDNTSAYEHEIGELCRRVTNSEPYVSVNSKTSGIIDGVVIILDGVSSPSISLKITEMLSALYSVPSSRIYVTEKAK